MKKQTSKFKRPCRVRGSWSVVLVIPFKGFSTFPTGIFAFRGDEMVYVYINTATYQGAEVVKVGVTNNVRKRTREFNNGVRHRSAHFSDLHGVSFSNKYSFAVCNRGVALDIERAVLKNFRRGRLAEFGREVFKASGRSAVKFLKSLIGGHGND